MKTTENKTVTIETEILAHVKAVWKYWNSPEDIMQWNNASDDWHTPHAEVDLREGGRFSSRMEARDGSAGFYFEGIYNKIEVNREIQYTIADGRKVTIYFIPEGVNTKVVETFEAESQNSVEMQRQGWQAILDNFKQYAEAQTKNKLL